MMLLELALNVLILNFLQEEQTLALTVQLQIVMSAIPTELLAFLVQLTSDLMLGHARPVK